MSYEVMSAGLKGPLSKKFGAYGATIKAQRHEVPTSNLEAKRAQNYLT
jgi:hypothetical protein